MRLTRAGIFGGGIKANAEKQLQRPRVYFYSSLIRLLCVYSKYTQRGHGTLGRVRRAPKRFRPRLTKEFEIIFSAGVRAARIISESSKVNVEECKLIHRLAREFCSNVSAAGASSRERNEYNIKPPANMYV